jgi:acetoin utilization protein AcuC
MRAAFVHSPRIEEYSYPEGCPFRTERAAVTRETLRSMDLLGGKDRREVTPEPASREDLLRFHAARYLEVLQAGSQGYLDVEGLGMGLGTEETPVFAGMLEYAELACGASLKGAKLILDGEVDVAFNPSGGYHHAHAARAGGFCYLNDVVLACQRLAEAGKRVFFLDIDVHHCDGVQDAFYTRKDVVTMSFHQDPKTIFPWTGAVEEIGEGDGVGASVNVPLPAGTDDEAFLRAFRELALPLLKATRPDALVLELGMDMLAGDPLADLMLTNNAHADAIEALLSLRIPILATGGGGYNVKNTVRGWALAWSTFCGETQSSDEMSFGLGGVMLETTDWRGGLRDRVLVTAENQRAEIDAVVNATIEKVKATVFPLHGL